MRAVKLCTALERRDVVKVHEVLVTSAIPSRVEPSKMTTTSPLANGPDKLPANASVLSLEALPLAILPTLGSTLSTAPVKLAVTVGATVSTVNARTACVLTLPAASVAVAVMLSAP